MFGMSMAEIAVIMILALVIMGPEKLPEVARTIGKTLREVRKAGNMLRDAIMLEDELKDYKKNNRSIAQRNTLPATGAAAGGYQDVDLDDYHGALDQLDDEEWGVGGAVSYDPYGHAIDRHEVEVELPDALPTRDMSHEVTLATTDFSPPVEPDLHDPYGVAHVEVREVYLHEQLPEADR